jgi:3-oxoacyl-[acyl-carrier-protein] synthase III
MAVMQVSNVRLAGLASAVPEGVATLADDAERFGQTNGDKISESLGLRSRRVVSGSMCASDLCHAAAEKLLEELGWDRSTVQALIFVSQTPDYVSPATSCTLQTRLGLATTCAALDINLGCSGYVYGLATAAQFARSFSTGEAGSGRVLLLAGDTISRTVSPGDRSAVPLFGDAGTATALEFSDSAELMSFSLGTDGSGSEHLTIKAGAFRHPSTEITAERSERENDNIRSDEDLYMNGAEVFAFTLGKVPALFKQTIQTAGWTLDDIDGVIMHQANAFLLNHLRKRLKIPEDKFIVSLDGYGNTSCASIPLAMTNAWSSVGRMEGQRLILAGFGVGWSWAGVAVTCADTVLPELVIVPDSAAWQQEAA